MKHHTNEENVNQSQIKMKVVEDIEKIDERSVFDGIYVQEKLVAWCAVCDVLHFYVCEKLRKGHSGNISLKLIFSLLYKNMREQRPSGFPERLLPKTTFFPPFFQPSLLSPFTANGVSLENMVMLLRHEDTRRHSHKLERKH